MGICIADVPRGCLIKVYSIRGEHTGRVTHNYGSSVEILTEAGVLMNFSNNALSGFDIMDKESIALYRQSQSRATAEFEQMLSKMK